jgi:hypothetical protein
LDFIMDGEYRSKSMNEMLVIDCCPYTSKPAQLLAFL